MNNTYNLSQSERVYLGRIGTTKTITLPSRVTEPARPAKRIAKEPKADLQDLMNRDANFKKWIVEFTKAAIEKRVIIDFDKSDIIEYVYLRDLDTSDKALDLYLTLTSKRVDSNPKGAGRKRLDEPVKTERIEMRRDAVVNQRKTLDETRRQRKQSKQEFDKERHEKRKEVLNDRERLQSLQNKTATTTATATVTKDDLPAGCTIVEGIFAQKGKTAIRINAKTIIYVKHGYNIHDAIEKHLLHQKLQLAI